jgi:preprotein translocase subunit SecE
MSRAVRRQRTTQPKEASGGRRGINLKQAPQASRGARAPVAPRRRFRPGLPSWLSDIVSELRKVTWPTRDETTYLTMVVIVVSVAIGIVLGGVDVFFNWLVDRLLLR